MYLKITTKEKVEDKTSKRRIGENNWKAII